jgi:hypothetical protein
LQESSYQFFKDSIHVVDLDAEKILAVASVDLERRKPNDELRKFLYKKYSFVLILELLNKEKGGGYLTVQ